MGGCRYIAYVARWWDVTAHAPGDFLFPFSLLDHSGRGRLAVRAKGAAADTRHWNW